MIFQLSEASSLIGKGNIMKRVKPKSYNVTIIHNDNGYLILGREIVAHSDRTAKQIAWTIAEALYGKIPYNVTTTAKLNA